MKHEPNGTDKTLVYAEVIGLLPSHCHPGVAIQVPPYLGIALQLFLYKAKEL